MKYYIIMMFELTEIIWIYSESALLWNCWIGFDGTWHVLTNIINQHIKYFVSLKAKGLFLG